MKAAVYFMESKRVEDWEKQEIHCPSCGNRGVWWNTRGNDIDSDTEEYICTNCKTTFRLCDPQKIRTQDDIERLKFLEGA